MRRWRSGRRRREVFLYLVEKREEKSEKGMADAHGRKARPIDTVEVHRSS